MHRSVLALLFASVLLWLAAKRSSRTAVERHRRGTQDDFHQPQGHQSRGGWKVRPDGRGCPENQIQLPNTTSDSSSRNHPAGGEREAGDVPETLQKSYCRDYLDYICVDQCGKLLRPNYVTEHFSWLIEKYGLRKVRFHDLRHTCASLLLSNGISMKQIQIWLGHSTFSTTADIYAHLDYSAQEASANAMNGMFNRPEKEEQLA